MRSRQPLTDDQLHRIAPSIFSVSGADHVSNQFKPIASIDVVRSMRGAGWTPVEAFECGVRKEARRGFQKHRIRFQHAGNSVSNVGDAVPEILLTNANDATAAYRLHAALFRLICSNGMVVADQTFESIRFVHKGFDPRAVIEASYRVIDGTKQIAESVQRMQSVQLSSDAQSAMAGGALTLAYGDETKAPVKRDDILRARRSLDQGADVWRVFNRIQENLVRGGLSYRSENGRWNSTRAIKSIDKDTRLNKALWQFAEEIAKQAA